MDSNNSLARDSASITSLFSALFQLDDETEKVTLALSSDTVCNFITNDLLLDAVIWLLGYDASKPKWLEPSLMDQPIRPQREDSHWATAWCITLFLQARVLLAPKHDNVTSEIDRRLTSADDRVNPLLWLLREAKETTDGRTVWYGKVYDNAVAALALLEVKRTAQAQSSTFQMARHTLTRVDEVLASSLRWLWDCLHRSVESGTTDDEAIAVLEPLLVAVSEFRPFLERVVWPGDQYSKRRDELITAIRSWMTVLEARQSNSVSADREAESRRFRRGHDLELTSDEAYALCQFVLKFQGLSSASDTSEDMLRLAKRAQSILMEYIKFLELGVQQDLWGGNISRIQRIGTYVQAWVSATSHTDPRLRRYEPDTHCVAIILKVLSMIKRDQFSNGSVFHSSLPTVHLVRSLIILWHWPNAKKPLLALFSRVLDDFAVRSSNERIETLNLHKQIVELEGSLIANERKSERLLKHLDGERRRRYLVMIWFWLLLTGAAIPIADAYFHLSRSELLTFTGVSASTLAIILVLIEATFARRNSEGKG